MAPLENSGRSLLKATHTPIAIPAERMRGLGRALEKSSFLRSVALRDGEVQAVREARVTDREIPDEVWDVLARFEPQQVADAPMDRSTLAGVPVAALTAFGEGLVRLRSEVLAAGQAPAVMEVREARPNAGFAQMLSLAQTHVHLAQEGLDSFTRLIHISPIGMLHLERIEMHPVGVERGELLATIPLAPGETTAVEHKEWTVTEEDLSTIVTDALEEYTERGVTEKSELAQATTSESKRSQQLGLSATLSGSYGFVSFSATSTFTSALEAAESKKDSRTQAKEVTSKASSRVRKERKVTIQAKTVTGSQETSTRQIVNPSTTDGMRLDYFSLMRKWRVRLLQYGLRQTYDIAIPSPGATLRGPFVRIRQINDAMRAPFTFDVKVDDINEPNYRVLATQYGVAVPEPPGPPFSVRLGGQVPGLDHGEGWHFQTVEVDVPENCEILDVQLDAMLGNVDNDDPGTRTFLIFGYGGPRKDSNGNPTANAPAENGRAGFWEDLTHETGFMLGARGKQIIHYFLRDIDTASVTFVVTYKATPEARSRWQFAVWQALKQAASDAHYAAIQSLAGEREVLVESISALDTLTLRREEREEIMKGVLRWLLGPGFEFMPDAVVSLFSPGGLSLTGNELGISESQWGSMFRYQEMVKFLHQAIEWENLLSFVYPYFWDLPSSWDFVRTIDHPDPERQQFLRAGSARVVLTVRPGFERAFAEFVDLGAFGSVLPANHPYVTIGEEIAAFGRTNYPGVPPANPAQDYRSLLSPEARKAWQEIGAIVPALEAWKEANGDYPTTAAGLAVLPIAVPAADPWGTPYVYRSPGRFTDYELSSAGPDKTAGPDAQSLDDDITTWAPASLIAEWFEYTPSRGTDIAVNSVLAELG